MDRVRAVTAISVSSNVRGRQAPGPILAILLGIGALWTLATFSQSGSAQMMTAPKAQSPNGPSSPDCGPDWVVVPSPNQGTGNNYLNGVAAIAANDVWAVGYYDNGTANRTLTLHWNGATWSVVPSPNQGTDDNTLYGVAAIAANDVWAVGAYSNGSVDRTLTLHWNGATWNVITSPNQGTNHHELYGVAAVSASDVWAVGHYYTSTGTVAQTLVERWNGSAWNVVPSPNQGTDNNGLEGVAAVSASNIWAVGVYYTSTGTVAQTLVEHWNGATWSLWPSPNHGTDSNYLHGVAAVSASDVWAVGNYFTATSTVEQTLVERWNGSAWNVVPSPNQGTDNNILDAVAAVSASNIWAVGVYYTSTGSLEQTLVERWNGSAWNVVPSPNQGTDNNALYGVAAVSASDVWAVGDYYTGTVHQTLVERYNPCPGSPTPTRTSTTIATATRTATGTATRTPLPTQTVGGATATPNATSCPIQFTDVPQGSTFYPYIRCLACRTIVGGYTTSPPCTTGTPCFLPQNNVTRGQIAKFVSNAAGYQDPIPPTRQTFTDVAPNSTFWLYIERAYLHQVISGYTTSPPCITGVPCFLPQNNVTRGQTAKFVSNSANYQDPIPPTRQTFTDVPPNSTFWLYVERAYVHSVIAGYTTSPPCTNGTPCFLPSNNVTRGQTAKFISNAFFPGCITP